MSLVADYSSSSCSGSDDDDLNEKNAIFKNEIPKLPLPSANVLLSKEKPGEVFSNPYKEAENAKIAVLEKHVKMVDPEGHLREKNGKKICWNYRKGRCRFGSNCAYAHDSDLQSTIIDQNDEGRSRTKKDIPLRVTISKPQSGLQIGGGVAVTSNPNSPINTCNNPNEQKSNKANKQRRPGLSDSIVPSKRVMKQYNIIKDK